MKRLPGGAGRLFEPDRGLLIGVVVWSVLYLLLLLRSFGVDAFDFVTYPVLVLVLVPIVLGALITAARRVEAEPVRWFFRGLALAHAFWLLAVLVPTALESELGPAQRLAVRDGLYGLYVAVYLCALELARIDFRSSMTERVANAIGSVALIGTGVAYWHIAPGKDPVLAYPLYVALGLYVVLRQISLAVRYRPIRLYAIYGLLAIASVLVLFSDALGAAYSLGILRFAEAPFIHSLWFVSYLPLLLATRVRLPCGAELLRQMDGARRRQGSLPSLWSPLVAYAFVLPAIHVFLYATQLGDPDAERLRAVSVVAWLALVAVLILVQHAAMARRLAASDRALRRSVREVRSLIAARERAAETERGRLARDLRRELGQPLAALEHEVAWLLENRRAEGSERSRRLLEADRVLQAALGFSQRLATDLRPTVLDDFGLATAIQLLTEETSRRSGLEILFRTDGSESPPRPDIDIALYRIVQESLTNVLKHARAERVEVHLRRRGEWLELAVRDDGGGVDRAALSETSGLGLLGIQERAHAIAARVQFDSGLGGRGFSVTVRVPLSAADRRAAATG